MLCDVRAGQEPYSFLYCRYRERVNLVREKFQRVINILHALRDLEFKLALYLIIEPFAEPVLNKLGRSITFLYEISKEGSRSRIRIW